MLIPDRLITLQNDVTSTLGETQELRPISGSHHSYKLVRSIKDRRVWKLESS